MVGRIALIAKRVLGLIGMALGAYTVKSVSSAGSSMASFVKFLVPKSELGIMVYAIVFLACFYFFFKKRAKKSSVVLLIVSVVLSATIEKAALSLFEKTDRIKVATIIKHAKDQQLKGKLPAALDASRYDVVILSHGANFPFYLLKYCYYAASDFYRYNDPEFEKLEAIRNGEAGIRELGEEDASINHPLEIKKFIELELAKKQAKKK